MTFEEFDEYTTMLMEKVCQMRNTKGKEYAGDKDRFDNFNRLAVKCGNLDRKLVWLVYFTKHIDAIESFISNGRTFSEEGIEGRIVDAITYLTLLAGMIKEEKVEKAKVAAVVERRNCFPVDPTHRKDSETLDERNNRMIYPGK